MKKTVLLTLFILLLFGAFQGLSAADCVEVDIELPAEVIAEPGNFAEGYFELTNCGDEAATVNLNLAVTLIVDLEFQADTVSFDMDLDLPIGAGETVSREFRFPTAAMPGTITVDMCLAAVIGEAEASDCATMVIIGGSLPENSAPPKVDFTLSAAEGDCVEVALELPDTVVVEGPSPAFVEGYFELTNCGDEAAEIILDLEASITIQGIIDTTINLAGFPVKMAAGETFVRSFKFPAPPLDGVYTMCVTTTSGEAVAVSCQTMVVVGSGFPPLEPANETGSLDAQNYPNPFNPNTNIAFYLPEAARVTVTVFNILGQEINNLANNDMMSAGQKVLPWDGRNANGQYVSSGVYFYRIEAGELTATKKMLLMK